MKPLPEITTKQKRQDEYIGMEIERWRRMKEEEGGRGKKKVVKSMEDKEGRGKQMNGILL